MLRGPSAGLYGQTVSGRYSSTWSASGRPPRRSTKSSALRVRSIAFRVLSIRRGRSTRMASFSTASSASAMRHDGQQDFVHQNKVFIAPSLTWRPTTDTSLTILSQYQNIDNKGWQQYVPGDAAGCGPIRSAAFPIAATSVSPAPTATIWNSFRSAMRSSTGSTTILQFRRTSLLRREMISMRLPALPLRRHLLSRFQASGSR